MNIKEFLAIGWYMPDKETRDLLKGEKGEAMSDWTGYKVLYEALEQAVRPLEQSIVDASNKVYGLSKEEIEDCKSDRYSVADLLDYAAGFAWEYEHDSKRGS